MQREAITQATHTITLFLKDAKPGGTLRLNLLSSYGKTPEGPERVERVKDTNGLTNQVTQL